MTNKDLGEDWAEHKERVEAVLLRYYSKEIEENEARQELAKLGFNATEIQIELEQAKPVNTGET